VRIALALAACVFLIVVLSIARRSSPSFPVSDEAVIELSTINALQGHQRLGPYSRYGWNHPGPALYYAIAPFYGLSGKRTVGLAAGALAINAAAAALMVWVLVSRGSPALAATFAIFLALYLGRVDGLLASFWNAHMTILAAMGVIVTSAAVAAGGLGMIPVFVVLASFVVQTHIALLPLAAIAGLGVVAGVIQHARPVAGVLNRAAWTALALWLLPIVEQLAPTGGNITRMGRFAVGQSEGAAPTVAFEAWADMMSAVVRPGLALPKGLLLAHDGSGWAGLAAMVEFGLLLSAGWWAYRRGRRFHMWLVLELVVVSVAALWAASRIPDGIHDHEVFWISAVALLNIVAIVAVPVGLIGEHIGRTWHRGRMWDAASTGARLATALCLVMVAGQAVAGVRELKKVADRSRVMTPGDLRIDHATRAVEAEIVRTGAHRPKILIDQPVWEAAAGVILQLRKKGRIIAIQPGLESMFSGTVAADGTEDLEITFCGGPCHARAAARPDNTVVLLGDGLAIDGIALKPR
jgi:hypothetical protein